MSGKKDWLERKTNKSNEYWFARVQTLIAKNTKKRCTKVDKVLSSLISEVAKSMPPDGKFDENMWLFAVLSQIMALWYVRVHRGKCYDSNRPLNLRQRSYGLWLEYVEALMKTVYDERRDSTYLPTQTWEYPFDPDAKSGGFQ